MGWFNKDSAAGDGTPKRDNVLFMVIAAIILLFREPAIWLKDKVYRGWTGGFRAFLGLIFSFGASYVTGNYLGWDQNWPTLGWLASAVGAWFVTYIYAWPALYHFVIRKVFDLVEWIGKGFRAVAKKYAEKAFKGLVLGLGRVLPFSGRAWNVLLDEKRHSWVSNLLGALSYVGTFAGSIYIGWETFSCVSALGFWGLPMAPFIAGVAAGVLVFGLVFGALFELLSHGKMAFLGTALTGALTYIYAEEIMGYGAQAGLTGNWIYASLAVFFVVFLEYVFPYAYWTLSGDLVKRVIKQIGNLCDAAYGDKNEGYVKFFGHTFNILATVAIGFGSYYVCGLIGLTAWSALGLAWAGVAVSAMVTAAVVMVAYLGVYECLFDHKNGFGWAAALVSLYAGYQAFEAYTGAELQGGFWVGAPVGALAALIVGTVLIPALYMGLRWVLLLVRADLAGEPLNNVYNKVEEGVKKLFKHLEKVYEVSYKDRTGYQEWFLHASNVAVAVGLWFLSVSFCAWAGFGAACTLGLTIPLVVLSYILVGKFLFKSTVGTEFIGVLTGLVAAVQVGTLLHAELPSTWLTVFVGFFTWVMVVFLFFPVAYLIVKLAAKPILASWSLKPLAWVHGKAWAGFKVVADGVRAAYILLKAKLAPVFARIKAAYAKIVAAYERIKGGSKKS
ncbi:MAG: hypothetical protein K2W95_32185 [Candidatus Obscuribacterales bacterium]|nr:hypothetical protein [Candidatus Obscuribacterales bacterium]